jgi:peptidoglycan hydrolase-like protein with peptidoglycan-binding domain
MPLIPTDEIRAEAITVEDDDPFTSELLGEEADAPADTGRSPDENDIAPPDEFSPFPNEAFAEMEESLSSAWRPAKALVDLQQELNARWPHRDKRTDGMIGDDAHCGPRSTKTSDHCPNAARVVRAYDIDVDGIKAGWLAEHVRLLGISGDLRLDQGGYVIYNRRIASDQFDWRWREYRGDPHTSHVHVSLSRLVTGYDNRGDWGVARADIPISDPGADDDASDLPVYTLGARTLSFLPGSQMMRGTDVVFVQRWTGAENDGWYGRLTEARVRRYQSIVGLAETGVVGPETWSQMRVASPT